MKKFNIKIYHSYAEADRDILADSLKMSPAQRVNAVNIVRRRVFKLKGINADNRVKKVISYAKREY